MLYDSLSQLPELIFERQTYLLSGALLEKLPIVQPMKNFPVFYGT
jgi:hypothetical protein